MAAAGLGRQGPAAVGRLSWVLAGVALLGVTAWLLARPRVGASPGAAHTVVLFADAHLVGPQYVCCSESNDVDNDSIMKTLDRLKAAAEQVESLSAQPTAAIFLGDVIHNGYISHDFEWYLAQRNAYTLGGEVFGGFGRLPVHFLWGNHDYKTTCGSVAESFDRQLLSHRLFKHFLGARATPYSAVAVGRYSLLLLNAQLGPSWDPTHPRCDTKQSSLGAEQLAWLAEQLKAGRPTFVFIHYPLPASMRGEAPELEPEGAPDLMTLLLAHAPNIMAVFSGHYHRGLDWGTAYPFPHLTLPAVRYDEDNFFLLHLPQAGPLRSWRLLDWSKNKGGARCSDTWDYPPGQPPRPRSPQAQERGSCGRPSLEEVGKVQLAPLESQDEVPGATGQQFNPEAPCSLAYQPQFLARCLREGASAACCDIIGEHLRPSSAAYGASCMCHPPFWQQAEAAFRAAGRNASDVLQACYAEHAKPLQWPGRTAGSCLRPGSAQLPPLR